MSLDPDSHDLRELASPRLMPLQRGVRHYPPRVPVRRAQRGQTAGGLVSLGTDKRLARGSPVPGESFGNGDRGQEGEVRRPCLGNKLCIYEKNAQDDADEAGGGISSSEEGVGCVTTTYT